jgi:hypothetical protein
MAPPKSGSRLCTNGCRGFWIGDRHLNVSDAPFDLTKQTEQPELRNRLSWSEDLSNPAWVKSPGITVTTGQTDPFGTNRAVLLTNAGTTSGASLRAALNTAGLGQRVFVKFWAKAGTLDRLDLLLHDGTASIPDDGLMQVKLDSTLREYKTSFTVLDPTHSQNLYLYVGDSSQVNTGTLTIFGLQVSDYDSDYVKTAGAPFSDTNFGARFERKVEFARDIVVGGVSTNPSTDESMHESWCSGFSSSGLIGTLGWRTAGFASGVAGLDSYGATAGVGGGCAIQFRQAAATANAGLIVYLGGPDGTAQSQFNASPWWVQSSINLESTTSETIRFGKSSALVETGTDGAFIRYIGGADSQFMCEVIKAGVVTTSGIGVTPAANTWYKARIERDAGGNVTCTVNSSSATINSANTPGAVAVFDIFEVKSLTAAQWRLRSRYYEQHWTGLTR